MRLDSNLVYRRTETTKTVKISKENKRRNKEARRTTSGGCSTSRVTISRTSSSGLRPVRLTKDLRKVALRIQERQSIARTRESRQVGGGPKEAGANRGKRKRSETTIETDG
ncbi:hypothetical protein K0M31_001472 [Melipona bicolor]|uniref:Uncharacterized protein n=1 Tax=Melipona bicolor TaxID=60889 RepID=A0AA40KXQ7_9HYME|nr:hypothetical protein K0M31_001472 [Melipona bicolor]